MLTLSDVYTTTVNKCNDATNMVAISNTLYENRMLISFETYTSEFNHCILDGAFLKVFTAFEFFLEKSFICFMMGQPGLNGNSIVRYVTPTDIDHAYDFIKSMSNKFADFTNRDTILKLAKTFFEDGGSYTYLDSIASTFEEMKKVRNAITHISESSTIKFENMVRANLGNLPTCTTTASFLNSFDPQKPSNTFYSKYKTTVISAIEHIANPT